MHKIEGEIGGRKLIIETGKVAKKSSGAVWIQYGENIVLVTAVLSTNLREEISFVPLTVDYREKAYAAGKIPGGFFKREGKPSEEEILSCRLIDRSIRPLFPKNFKNETQIIASVLSAGEINQSCILGIIGASVALCLSDKMMEKLIGAVRVARVGEEFIMNPTDKQLETSDLNLVIAGNKEGITMVEGEVKEVEESVVLKALKKGYEEIKKMIELEEKFILSAKVPKEITSLYKIDEELKKEVDSFLTPEIEKIQADWSKEEKDEHVEATREKLLQKFLPLYAEKEGDILTCLEELKKKKMREMIIRKGKRWDGRGLDDVRKITCEVGILPRVHGSSLFSRGDTQSLVVLTLGTSTDEQIIDGLQTEDVTKRFMFHYNFPPFSTGEAYRMGPPGRREIGHGFLAERALAATLPDENTFPYTIRLVSDILESNGSSSMASACGGSLALMDGGVPISKAVAGLSIGLVKENGESFLLTDIQGMEDYLGDMDFKIAGTESAVTALQLDIKTDKIDFETLEEALKKAKSARKIILQKMAQVINEPRKTLPTYAPRIATINIPLDKISDVIGPGGRVIKKLTKETGAKIDIDDVEGKVIVSSMSEESTNIAVNKIKDIIREFKVGEAFRGTVKRVTNFGAFVEISPGKEGLVHISKLSDRYVKNASDVVSIGDEILVEIIGIDELGRLSLGKKKS
ncbi:polyribonucleotide nucleotidyltransferase [Candidatus Aerophobetes bacterium]|nr:polyribonucleotide nucleotidyltransferase [Candidatus Aerophobetes bacterium]